jgi:hypothetical protein
MPTVAEADALDDPVLMEAGRRLFAQRCDFVAGVADLAQLPPAAARSRVRRPPNVGKSS